MGLIIPPIKDGDWRSVRQAIAKLASLKLGYEATPTYAGLTLTGLTATRLIQTDASKALTSVSDLTSWIAGTANQITVADDGDGTVTLATPQNIHTGATPTFAGLIINGTIAATSIGAVGDVDLLSFAANALTVNGTIGCGAIITTGDLTISRTGTNDVRITFSGDGGSSGTIKYESDNDLFNFGQSNIFLTNDGIFFGGIAIGKNSRDTNILVDAVSAVDANIVLRIKTTNDDGINAAAILRAEADNVIVSFQAHGPARTLSRFGEVLADWGEFLSVGASANGLIIGTSSPNKPFILGTESIRAIKIDGSNQDVLIGLDDTAHLLVESDGDTFWVGAGTGLPYAEAQQADGSTFNVTMTTVNVWVEVDAATTNITAPEKNLVTFPDDHYLLCQKAGHYLVTYSFTAEINSVAGGDQHVESGIMVNDSIQVDKGLGHEQYAATNKERNLQGHTIIDVPTNGQVSLAIKNTTSSGKILTIDHLNMTVTQVGGT